MVFTIITGSSNNAQISDPELGFWHGLFRLIDRNWFDCFYLTESLLPRFLEVIGGRQNNATYRERAARHVLNFVAQFDDVLVINGTDLYLLEILWTDTSHSVGEGEGEEDSTLSLSAAHEVFDAEHVETQTTYNCSNP